MAQGKERYTVEEYERYIAVPANHDRLLELIDGQIVEKMLTQEQGMIAAAFCGEHMVVMYCPDFS